jgi:hypothetical protein
LGCQMSKYSKSFIEQVSGFAAALDQNGWNSKTERQTRTSQGQCYKTIYERNL